MKTLIRVLLIVAVVLAVVLGTWAVKLQYDNYRIDRKNAERAAAVKAESAADDAHKAVEAEMSALRISHELVRQECLKGQAAYNSLSTFNQSKLSAPQCGQALDQ